MLSYTESGYKVEWVFTVLLPSQIWSRSVSTMSMRAEKSETLKRVEGDEAMASSSVCRVRLPTPMTSMTIPLAVLARLASDFVWWTLLDFPSVMTIPE